MSNPEKTYCAHLDDNAHHRHGWTSEKFLFIFLLMFLLVLPACNRPGKDSGNDDSEIAGSEDQSGVCFYQCKEPAFYVVISFGCIQVANASDCLRLAEEACRAYDDGVPHFESDCDRCDDESCWPDWYEEADSVCFVECQFEDQSWSCCESTRGGIDCWGYAAYKCCYCEEGIVNVDRITCDSCENEECWPPYYSG